MTFVSLACSTGYLLLLQAPPPSSLQPNKATGSVSELSQRQTETRGCTEAGLNRRMLTTQRFDWCVVSDGRAPRMLHGAAQSVSLGGIPRGSPPAVPACTVSWDQVRPPREPDPAEPKWGFSPGPNSSCYPFWSVWPSLVCGWLHTPIAAALSPAPNDITREKWRRSYPRCLGFMCY